MTTLAYVQTQAVTPNIHPSPNTVIFYAPIRQRAGALGCLPWEDIPQIMQEFAGWRETGARIYVWDYINQSTYVARIRVKPSLRREHKPKEHAFGLWLWKSGFPGDAVQGRNVSYDELTSDDWQFIYLLKVYFYSPAVEGCFYNTIGPLDEGEAFLYDLIEFIPIEQFPDKNLADSLPTITL